MCLQMRLGKRPFAGVVEYDTYIINVWPMTSLQRMSTSAFLGTMEHWTDDIHEHNPGHTVAFVVLCNYVGRQ